MLKLKSISPSRIKTFDMCKFKYWLTYNRPDIELKSNWGAVHGTLIHDVCENLSNGEDTDWTSRLYRGYAGTLETLDRRGQMEIMASPLLLAKKPDFKDKKPYCDTCPYENSVEGICNISTEPLDKLTGCPKDLFNGSVRMMEDVISRYTDVWDKILKDENGVPIGSEYKFNIPVPGTDVPMIGIMDLVIEEDPETIHVIDYKAGKWTQNYEECLDDIQVLMYSLASRREFIDDINKKGYNYKNIVLTFDYFTNKPITLALTEEDDLKTEAFVRNKIKEIQGTKWINRIVRSNDDFSKRSAWKCNAICDSAVCGREWKGQFSTDEKNT